MDFPLIDYLDEDACYRKLVELLHPAVWLVRHVASGNASGSTTATGSRFWTTSAVTAVASSTPGPGPSCRGRTVAPLN